MLFSKAYDTVRGMTAAARRFRISPRNRVHAAIRPLLAAGVAFYAFLAIFPALIAVVSTSRLFADPSTIANQLNSLTSALPEQARQVITDQVTMLASRRSTLGIGLIISVVIALWSASAGVSNLLTAINVAYDEEEKRGFVKKRLLSLGLTLGAIVFMVIVLGLVAVLPPLLRAVFGTSALRWILQILGWLVLVVLVAAVLAILDRLGPDRDAPRMAWASVGAVVATLIWLAASIGFSLYASTFGNYAKTYGVFAGIVVLLFWLWLTMYAILLGAEINAEAEQQTIQDTTKGEEEPLGERGAVKADSVPIGDPEAPQRKTLTLPCGVHSAEWASRSTRTDCPTQHVRDVSHDEIVAGAA
jgi:membrane protein